MLRAQPGLQHSHAVKLSTTFFRAAAAGLDELEWGLLEQALLRPRQCDLRIGCCTLSRPDCNGESMRKLGLSL
ncbi:hypothetical protein [Mumia zhuanghuii]|uniref:Uncharacterized protein n=1 Tax=Mumia zhuanghuii TaxID=2585211 RepID=A0A5C4LT45_9ACTN|nr:hypothetical protein [Mumia zhuanghuii]TNC21768.1 hypothetical protein FHE65_36295 [Mumia zhuanghuii]